MFEASRFVEGVNVPMTTLEMFPLQGVEFHEENQRVLETGALIESEVVYQRSDGVAVPTISRLYRVTTIDEKNYLIGSITDTSVLKKRENQLIVAQQQAEAANSDLESIVESVGRHRRRRRGFGDRTGERRLRSALGRKVARDGRPAVRRASPLPARAWS